MGIKLLSQGIIRWNGEVTEWLKVHAWKVCVRGNSYREFESHPLRQINTTRFYAWSY